MKIVKHSSALLIFSNSFFHNLKVNLTLPPQLQEQIYGKFSRRIWQLSGKNE